MGGCARSAGDADGVVADAGIGTRASVLGLDNDAVHAGSGCDPARKCVAASERALG